MRISSLIEEDYRRHILSQRLREDFGNDNLRVDKSNNSLYITDNDTIHFYLSEFPGTCGIVVMHSLPIPFKKNLFIAEYICEYLTYTILMISDNKNFDMYIKSGFNKSGEVLNRRSDNIIAWFWKELDYD